MNDRELLEFIAAQVGNLTSKVDKIDVELKDFKEDMTKRITKIEMVLENQTNPQIMLLSEGQQGIIDRLEQISDKVEHHDIKIQVIEGGKRA